MAKKSKPKSKAKSKSIDLSKLIKYNPIPTKETTELLPEVDWKAAPDAAPDSEIYKRLMQSFFPIVIRIIDTGEIKLIKSTDALPINKAFIITNTNERD